VSIRVLIVDDHAVVRAGLKLLVDAEDDLEAVGEAGSAREAVFEARTTKPDVVLMDVMMPEQSGLTVVPQLVKEHPEATVLCSRCRTTRATFARPGQAVTSWKPRTQARRGHPGRRGRRAIRASRLRPAGGRGDGRAAPGRGGPLSDREREVHGCWRLGTRPEIAKELYISVRTAETHRAHIMQKLRLSSRAELVRYALSEGLLESP
jgi:two-component system response regulator NreC